MVYILKKPQVTRALIQKTCKRVILDSSKSKQRALDAYEFFRNLVVNDNKDDGSKTQMVHCLKLAQLACVDEVKVLEVCAKMEVALMANEKGIHINDRTGKSEIDYNQITALLDEKK